MEITITFLTEKGKQAYNEYKNVKLNWKERRIIKHIFKEKVINTEPLKIHIKTLKGAMINLTVLQIDLAGKIRAELKEKGCVEDTDYIIQEA